MQRIIGGVCILFGFVQAYVSLSHVFITMPKLMKLYSDLAVDLPKNLSTSYIYAFSLLLVGIIGVIIGLGNFGFIFKDKSAQLFKYGIVFLVFSFVLSGFLSAIMVSSIVTPLYSFAK